MNKQWLKEFFLTFWKPYRDENNLWPETFEELDEDDLKSLNNCLTYQAWVFRYKFIEQPINELISDIKKIYHKLIS